MEDRKLERQKARTVAKRFTQVIGCHDLAKWLSYYFILFFFSFLFFSYLDLL